MTTSSLLSTPPLRITPALACLLRLLETGIEPFVLRFVGDAARLGPDEMNGFVKSAALAFENFVGEWLNVLTDAPVSGVLVSDLDLWRAGVLGV